MLLNAITYLALRRSMNMKHYQKIAQVRKTKQDRARAKIEQLDLETKHTSYMDELGNIDWDKLAKHVSEATSGR
jgi:hypothetical protein